MDDGVSPQSSWGDLGKHALPPNVTLQESFLNHPLICICETALTNHSNNYKSVWKRNCPNIIMF